MNRWAVYLDIEGTSKIYEVHEGRVYAAFDAILSTLCRIGSEVFPETPSRLFAHQVGGDGVVIVSEFAKDLPEAPISIAVVLLQVLLLNGHLGKAGISEGTFADIRSCFPSLRSVPNIGDGRYRLGRGLLTTFPVMGTALINSHRIATRKPRGARLTVDADVMIDVPDGVVISLQDKGSLVVDWIHTRTRATEEITSKAHIELPSPGALRERLVAYVANTGDATDDEWKHNTLSLNGCVDYEPRGSRADDRD